MTYTVRIWFKRRDGTPPKGYQEVRLHTLKDICVTNGYDGWTYLMLGNGRKMRPLQKYHAALDHWDVVVSTEGG